MVLTGLNLGVLAFELILLFTGLIIFLTDKLINNKNYAFYFSLLGILGGLCFMLFTPFGEFTASFKTDFYSATIKLFLIIGSILILMISYCYLQEFSALNFGEYYGLLLFSLLGSFIAISSQDFLTLYLGLELMSIPVYFLIATSFVYQRFSLEGAIKYFIVGAIASLFFLLSLAIIYYCVGSLAFRNVFLNLAQGTFKKELLYALVFILTAFSIKLSLVPFHMWAPDAYEAAPLPITSFLASLIKLTLFSALIKVLVVAFSPLRSTLGELLIPMSLITLLIGALLAIKQDNIIRMLAYSSITHVGYASLGLVTGDYLGYGFMIFYMVVYLFMTIGTFGLLIYLIKVRREFLQIPALGGLGKKLPFISFLFLIFLFSLTGIPPTAGFMAKFYIFIILLKGNFFWVALLALLFSIIGAYPYLRVIKSLYMDKPFYSIERKPYGFSLLFPVLICCLVILLLGIYPKGVVDFIQRTLQIYLSLLYFHF